MKAYSVATTVDSSANVTPPRVAATPLQRLVVQQETVAEYPLYVIEPDVHVVLKHDDTLSDTERTVYEIFYNSITTINVLVEI